MNRCNRFFTNSISTKSFFYKRSSYQSLSLVTYTNHSHRGLYQENPEKDQQHLFTVDPSGIILINNSLNKTWL